MIVASAKLEEADPGRKRGVGVGTPVVVRGVELRRAVWLLRGEAVESLPDLADHIRGRGGFPAVEARGRGEGEGEGEGEAER